MSSLSAIISCAQEINGNSSKLIAYIDAQSCAMPDTNKDIDENNHHVNCLFKQRVKRVQSSELV